MLECLVEPFIQTITLRVICTCQVTLYSSESAQFIINLRKQFHINMHVNADYMCMIIINGILYCVSLILHKW